jgi:hypothetical protein
MRNHDPDDPQLQEEFAAHIAQCAACRDDAAEPIGRLLAHVSGDVVVPPSPHFTQQIIARLPHASPLQLAQQEQGRRRWLLALSLAPIALLLLLFAVGPYAQTVWADSSFTLVADTLRQIAGAARWPLLLMVGSSIGLMALFTRLLRTPTARYAAGAILVAVALVVVNLAAGVFNDQNNAQLARTTGAATATVASSIETTQSVRGSIASLFGDVTVGEAVDGNVASLLGNVTVAPSTQVAGSVLDGSDNIAQIASASVIPGLSRLELSPLRGRLVIGIGGMLLLLALLGLTAALWPETLARASIALEAQPWQAVGFGLLLLSIGLLLVGPITALLAWSVIGLILLPLIVLALHLPLIVGLAVAGGVVAEHMFDQPSLPRSLIANGIVLAGLLALTLILPLAGAIVFYVMASIGFGALLAGTRRLAFA